MVGNRAARLALLALAATGAAGFGFPPPEALVCPPDTALRRVIDDDQRHELHCARPDGTKHGPFRRFEHGRREEGAFANGREAGTWRAWYANGKPSRQRHYVAGRLEGLEIVWNENGEIMSRGSYRADKCEGVWLNSNMHASGRGRYHNDGREGPWSFQSDGHRAAAGAYRDGEQEGPWVFYWNDGSVESRGSFRRGEKHGRWRYYSEGDGGRVWLRFDIECRGGEAHGKFVELSRDGRVLNECTFQDGLGECSGRHVGMFDAGLTKYSHWAGKRCQIDDLEYRTARD